MSKSSAPVRSTIEDVAMRAGVSTATVSRVINKTGPVAAKTAQRRYARKGKTDLSLPVGEHNTDGLIIFSDALDQAEITRLYRRKLPMVLLHRSPPNGVHIPCVTFDNKKGARALVEHLITVHQYRRIAFLAGFADDEDSYWRELGYREALTAHAIPLKQVNMETTAVRPTLIQSTNTFLQQENSG